MSNRVVTTCAACVHNQLHVCESSFSPNEEGGRSRNELYSKGSWLSTCPDSKSSEEEEGERGL